MKTIEEILAWFKQHPRGVVCRRIQPEPTTYYVVDVNVDPAASVFISRELFGEFVKHPLCVPKTLIELQAYERGDSCFFTIKDGSFARAYRSKPTTVIAIRLLWKNWSGVVDFLGGALSVENPDGHRLSGVPAETLDGETHTGIILNVRTIHGEVAVVRHGDYIVAEPNAPGRFYPCACGIFEKRYEQE